MSFTAKMSCFFLLVSAGLLWLEASIKISYLFLGLPTLLGGIVLIVCLAVQAVRRQW